MSKGTERWKLWLWLPLGHITGCYCTVESSSQESKEQHSNKQWFVRARLSGSLSDVSVHVNCMMIYETQFPQQYGQTDLVAQLGRAWEKAASRERPRLPTPLPQLHLNRTLKHWFGSTPWEIEPQGWGWASRVIRKMIFLKTYNPRIQMPWCFLAFHFLPSVLGFGNVSSPVSLRKGYMCPGKFKQTPQGYQ